MSKKGVENTQVDGISCWHTLAKTVQEIRNGILALNRQKANDGVTYSDMRKIASNITNLDAIDYAEDIIYVSALQIDTIPDALPMPEWSGPFFYLKIH